MCLKQTSSLGASIKEDKLKKEWAFTLGGGCEGELFFASERMPEEGEVRENPEGVISFLLQPWLLPLVLLHLSHPNT